MADLYQIETIEKELITEAGKKFPQTVVVTHKSGVSGKEEAREFGFIDSEQVYKLIDEGKPVVLDNSYVNGFSLNEYRSTRKLREDEIVELRDFSAKNAFFNCDKRIGFSYALFRGRNLDFSGSLFADGIVEFKGAIFEVATVNFQDTFFKKGDINFEMTTFSDGTLSFVNSNFGDGNVNFRFARFGNGKVDFQFSKFGNGEITFEKAVFGTGMVDFRKAELGDGKVDFRKAHFGEGDISFQEAIFGKGKVLFRKALFERGEVTFEMADFGEGIVSFERVVFNQETHVSFFRAKMENITFASSTLNNHLDLRVSRAECIDLRDTVVRDIIDFKPLNDNDVVIKELNISGMRNLGRVFIDWKLNKIKQLIINQKETSLRQKSYQFGILKQDFSSTGEYNDEDRAYVEFKRFEMRADLEEALKRNPVNAVWAYPLFFFKWLLFDKVGVFATDPVRVLVSMVVIYILFSLVYVFLPEITHADIVSSLGDPDKLTQIEKAFYHSAITFLTIGYGDYYPSGANRWLSSVEGFAGLFLMAYFTVAFVRKILR